MPNKLRAGQRVRMTDDGRRSFPRARSYYARVVRYVRYSTTNRGVMVLVHRDGYKSPESFHEDLWQPVEEESPVDE